MSLRHLIYRKTVISLSRLNGLPSSNYSKSLTTIATVISPPLYSLGCEQNSTFLQNPKPISSIIRYFHSSPETKLSYASSEAKLSSDSEEEEDGAMNEFLSRFVWIMRGKLSEVYDDCNKETIDSMLLIIVSKVLEEMERGGTQQILGSAALMPSQDFSEDLWRTVWEVSNMVLQDMEKARKKEKMKEFLQSEEVKEMCRFAGEVGIRGDLLRELRFKWAREKMEENDFNKSLECLRDGEQLEDGKNFSEQAVVEEEKPRGLSLPKRKGKIKYQIYGLDLSDPKWAKVADKIHEREEMVWPPEPKHISGKCKLVMEKILSLKMEDDPSQLLAEWRELLQPSRLDWITLLDRLEQQNPVWQLKVAEILLDEKSFETNIRDYTKLIDAHARENRVEDAERILKKMVENGIGPDIITLTVLVHMYCKVGNLKSAVEAFLNLKGYYGFRPDEKVYKSMIMALINNGDPMSVEPLMRQMETAGIKPSQEIYMALLGAFVHKGDVNGAERITSYMKLARMDETMEYWSLLVEVYGKAGNYDKARNNLDRMIKLGHRPDDKCIANMIAAYEKMNLLDKALNLLMQLEKDGFEPGIATYAVFLDWMCRLLLVDEAEQLLSKIAELGEVPPLKVHVSLCDMYARARLEKKALQALGVLEAKKDELEAHEFERIIDALRRGGFTQDAQRMRGHMDAKGFTLSDKSMIGLMSPFIHNRPMR